MLFSSSTRSNSGGGRPRAAVDLELEARRTLERAHAEATALMAAARHEAEVQVREMFELAREQGLEQGLAEGLATGREEGLRSAAADASGQIDAAVTAMTSAVESLNNVKRTVQAEAESGLVRLACTIAERLVRRALVANPAAAHAAISEAISLVVDRTDIRVLVSPADLEALEPLREQLRDEYPEIVRIAFEQDVNVAPGDCHIITSSATIDASLRARADAIAESLLAAKGDA